MGCDIYSMTDRWTDRQTPYKIITKCLLCFVEDTRVPLFWRKKKLQGYPGFEYILHSLLSPLTLHFVLSSCSISAEAVTIFCTSSFLQLVHTPAKKWNAKILNAKINEAEPTFLLHYHSPGNTFTYFQTKDMIENNILPKQTYKLVICFKIHNTTYFHVLVCQTKEQRDKVIAIKSLSYQNMCSRTQMPLLNTCSSTETKWSLHAIAG